VLVCWSGELLKLTMKREEMLIMAVVFIHSS